MGSYYEDVYLKRINKGGNTRQDRIKTKKEREFDLLFLKQSKYRVTLTQINDGETKIIGSLQPNKMNESNLIENLLLSTSAPSLKTGDIVQIKHQVKDSVQEKFYLVIFVEENLTKGYQLFKVICLDTNINITDEYGTSKYVTPAKFTNASQAFSQDSITRSIKEYGYREPQTSRIIITKDNDELKKGTYFEFKDRGWEIVGKDNISIDNVAYLFISERLRQPEEPLSSQDLLVGENDNFFLNGR